MTVCVGSFYAGSFVCIMPAGDIIILVIGKYSMEKSFRRRADAEYDQQTKGKQFLYITRFLQKKN